MSTDIVGSKQPSLASDALKSTGESYGQNAFDGSSSDTPGKDTRSQLAGRIKVADSVPANQQTRTVSADPYPTARGLSARDSKSDIGTDARPVTTRDVHTDLGRRVIDEGSNGQ